MTETSTTIRVSTTQRELLRQLAHADDATMAATLDNALLALRRDRFYRDMADAEATFRNDPEAWADYVAERDDWLNPDLATK